MLKCGTWDCLYGRSLRFQRWEQLVWSHFFFVGTQVLPSDPECVHGPSSCCMLTAAEQMRVHVTCASFKPVHVHVRATQLASHASKSYVSVVSSRPGFQLSCAGPPPDTPPACISTNSAWNTPAQWMFKWPRPCMKCQTHRAPHLSNPWQWARAGTQSTPCTENLGVPVRAHPAGSNSPPLLHLPSDSVYPDSPP